MKIASGDTSRNIYFIAVDSADFVTRETSLSDTVVYYSIDGGSATVMTDPNIVAVDATNMPGVFKLALDESGMVTAVGDVSELVVHITAEEMAPVTRSLTIVANTEKDIYDRIGAPVGASMSADLVTVDTVVDSIETKIDGIVTDISNLNNFDPSSDEVDVGKIKGEVISGTNDFKADVSLLATSEELLAVEGKIDTIDNIVDTIKSSTDPLTLVAIADAILSRAISNVEDSAGYRTLAGAVAKLVNKFKRTTTHLEVYKTDDTTKWWQQAITEDEDANPISEIDTE